MSGFRRHAEILIDLMRKTPNMSFLFENLRTNILFHEIFENWFSESEEKFNTKYFNSIEIVQSSL